MPLLPSRSHVVIRSLRALLPLASVLLPVVARAQIVPSVCVEYLPTGTSAYVARFSYLNLYATSAYIPGNTQLNNFAPFKNAAGQPSTFYPGYNFGAVAVKVGNGYTETWALDGASLTANSLAGQPNSTTTPLSPMCPLLLRPASLSYTAAGTYNNVYLAQVNAGPGAGGVTLTAQPSAGITVSNLVYTPADTSSPIAKSGPYEPNPNSVYGTVTVTSGAAANSTIALVVNVNGISNAQTLVPLTFTPPAYTISGMAVNGVQAGAGLTVPSGQMLQINVLFNYSGSVAPTGAISLQVDGTGYGLSNQTCTYKGAGSSPHQNCTVTYSASGPAGTHTLTFSQAGDANYTAFSGMANLTVTPPVVSSSLPAVGGPAIR